MSDPFLGEIRLFAGNYAPRGWALCQGQTMAISQNTALFSLLGTNYGGDGRSNFGLPNLQGRVPINQGQASGLSSYQLGQTGGEVSHTLTLQELPSHNHPFNGDHAAVAVAQAGGNYYGSGTRPAPSYGNSSTPTPMANNIVAPNSGGQAHPNQQPYLTLSYIIALQGIFPQRP